MSSTSVLKIGLIAISKNPRLVQKIKTLPNIPAKTAGGFVFWDNLEEFQGWCIQRNSIFGNCRLLNPNNERQAWWSSEKELNLAFQDFVKSTSGDKNRTDQSKKTNKYRNYEGEDISKDYVLPDDFYHDRSIDVRQDDWEDYIDYHANH